MDERRSNRFLCTLCLVVIGLLQPVSAQDTFQCNYTTNIDQDNDGLIEICDLNALSAIRHQLDGSGYKQSFDAVKITAGCPQSGCTGYELRGDLDFNSDDSYRDITNKVAWTSGLGWLPIGDRLNFFTARFEGNGHTIANLYINRPSDYVGLFNATTRLAKISDLILSQINIKGNSYVGSLAGHNAGGVAYIGVEGGRLIGMGNNVGGLLGANTGTVLNGDVMLEHIESNGHSLGGLVGHNEGHITYSVADTSLSGVSQVGGLIGFNSDGMLADSRTDGTAKGRNYIGGLVGLNRARINASHAESRVISEGSYSGGLVGANHRGSRIADSRASGAVSGNLYVGGLVGWNKDSEITNSFAVNRIEGNRNVGGLVGRNEDGQISNTYSSGFVTGMHRVGGLVGSNRGTVSDSFANGQVVASGEHVGGLIGWNYAHQTRYTAMVRVLHSYWDSEATEVLVSAGGSLRTTEQLKSPVAPGLLGETFERWDVADWDFGTNGQYPILRHSEGSNQGRLLPGQHIMLSGLLILDGLILSPAFDPQTLDYRINLSDDSVREIRFSPTIANSTQTISVLKDEGTSLPSVHNGETVSVNLNVAPAVTLITIARHYRIWVIRHSGLEATISSDHSSYRVNEGQSIVFNVSSSEPDPRRVRYRWRQISPTQPDLLKDSNTRQAELNIDIPDDFVAQNADETSVVLQVAVRANGVTAIRNTTMAVVKTNNGSLGTLAAPIYREDTLMVADLSGADLSMETDGSVDLSSFRYQWQYKLPPDSAIWQDIEDAMQTRYKVPQVLSAIDNISYRVWLDYRDQQGYDHRIVSEPLSVMNIVPNDGFSDIYYLEDLDAIRNRLNVKYELVRDLDFNSDESYRDPINKAKWTVADYQNGADTGWLPIGTFAKNFNGIFKGNGYTIFNLQINRVNAEDQGLFGALGSAAMVSNVGLVNTKIGGNQTIGGLAGFNQGTIAGSHVIGEVSGFSSIGGLVGQNNGKIINSHASVIVSAIIQHLGGLVGFNQGVVINSHSKGQVLSRSRTNGGGLIGFNSSNARIINSYTNSDVSLGSRNSAGGLVGINQGSITNSYATGNVSGAEVGGLARINQRSTALITNSYAIGKVQGSGGGLVASNNGGISASYWNTETSGLQGRHGSGQTTLQMQAPTSSIGIYEEWDDADWDFGNSRQYPILKYAPGPDGDGCSMSGLPSGLPQCGELISPHLRYGLRSLATADGVVLSPEFDVKELNQNGIYIGTLSSIDNTIRLTPTTMEPTAHISFYIGDDETAYDGIQSGETSKAISLKENSITRIRMEVQGTHNVSYTLYVNYQNTATDKVTTINYLEDLRAIHHQLKGSYKLARDLDFADNGSYLDPLNRVFWTVEDYHDANDTGWVPIGSETKPFAGSFDGNGYTISGLQINRDTTENQGLFGITSSAARISNLGLLHVKVEGGAKVAGLVGTNQGQVGYSYVVGSIRSKSGTTAGGLVASNNGGDIIGSYAISEVFGLQALGGLVGDNRGRIINSHADSIIMPDSGSTFGGLVGRNRNLIANSYATGKIFASDSSIMGGLVGWNDSRVINGYASVSIAGMTAGGLVGYNRGSITNSYAIGALKNGNRSRGSLVGSNEGAIVASYWNTDTIAVRTAGNHGIGQNTIQLRSGTSQSSDASRAYYEWGDNDWHFGDMELYPILKHTPASESVFACGSSGVPQCGDLISPGLRYGLRSLTLAGDASFYPKLDIERLNQSSVYVGTVFGEHPSIRLIPVAMETTARISIMGTVRETIDNRDTSSPISLKNNRINKVVVEVEGTKTVRYTLYLNYSSHRVIDEDNDGLVDINYLEDLDAIRHQLDGSGYRADADSFRVSSGCPNEGCRGYELLRDLDFNDADSYRDADANMSRWTGAGTWQPIAGTFVGTFKGNNKTIANLRLRQSGGLFASIGSDDRVAHIDGIGLLGVDIKAQTAAGIASSCVQCTISNSYVIGNIEGSTAAAGLLNDIIATSGERVQISNSYFIGNIVVNGRSAIAGGLIGNVDSDLLVTDSYAVGEIIGEHNDGFIGGLVGARLSSLIEINNSYASVLAIRAGFSQGLFGGNRNLKDRLAPTVYTSYLDEDISMINVTLGESKHTVVLQSHSPTTPSDSIYKNWDSRNWDFGNDKQYPAIKYNLRSDSTDGDAHCSAADPQNRPTVCRTLLRHQGSLLQDLKLSAGAGLSEPFIFSSFNYGISVNADQSSIRLLPTAFNAVAMVEVFKDGNPVGITDSGEWTEPIPLNDYGNTVVDLIVTEGNRHSYRYQFVINRLNIVAQNIDKDGDGLIDISNATHLNAIRHRLDGSAYQESATADVIYCLDGCTGYELTADIDLAEIYWQPLGSLGEPFTGVLKGNGHTISNLTLEAVGSNDVGLFAAIGNRGRVENIGLVNVNISANSNVGSIAGHNFGTIINSYASGRLSAKGNNSGGLVGRNIGGMIVNSYANVDVNANGLAGGLVGWNREFSLIVNSYAFGDVQVNKGGSGGLVGNNSARIDKSYATGEVRTGNGDAGGLVALGVLTIANDSYYRAGAVISGTDSLIGIDKTAIALKAGVPSDDIYTGWDRADWHFGNNEQYPALLYAASDDNNMACRQPPEQLSACISRLPGLSEHDKAVICRSHLPRLTEDMPYCGALLPGQRAGLIQMKFSENARLIPAFSSEIYDYDLIVNSGNEAQTTLTTYYSSDTITVDASGLSVSTSSGQSVLFTLNDDLANIIITVRPASHNAPTRYTIKVLHNIAVVDGFIAIDYLEDLNLMRDSLEQVSAALEDCPIDTQDNVRRCKGYKLTRELDFKDPESYRAGIVNPIWTTDVGWQPIGKVVNNDCEDAASRCFTGTFDGNGYTISNLRHRNNAFANVGLFGALAKGGRIENIGLVAVDIRVTTGGQSSSGALVGSNYGEIVNSYVIGGSIQSAGGSLGGLVGRNLGTIVNSYAHVDVGTNEVFVLTGGLAGVTGESAKIHNSYASGTVTGGFSAGGLAGYASADISNSYASAEVSGALRMGDLVGSLSGDTGRVSITNSYASGTVGGLMGWRFNGIANMSYWDTITSDTADDGINANGIGKTTLELQTPAIGEGIYSDWHHDIWYSTVGQYPMIRYTSATDVLTRPACQAVGGIDSEIPVCGTLLPGQRLVGLRSLALSNSAGQVFQLIPDFNSRIYNYELILKSKTREFSIIPHTFNPQAVILISDKNGTRKLQSGNTLTLIIDDLNNSLLPLTVEEPLTSMTTRTTLYQFKVSRHPFITINDIDEDDDGLIEIRSLDDLNVMRYQLDGSGYRASLNNIIITQGCPETGCIGYELMQDLDLADDVRFTNWQPIGYIALNGDADECSHPNNRCFSGIFNGNNHTISNLRIDSSDTDNVGLFAALADSAQVINVDLANVEVMGRNGVGTLVAYNAGEIDNSYVNGTVVGEHAVGGLVAYNVSDISNSYAYGVVSGKRSVGGLVARNESGGMIANSYSLNRVLGDNGIGGLIGLNLGSITNTYASGIVEGNARVGGLVGENRGSVISSYATADVVCTGVPECVPYTVTSGGLIGNSISGIEVNSYWDIEMSNIRGNIQGSAAGVGKTTLELQSGNSQSLDASKVYYKWNHSDWHFGNVYQYPILRYANSRTRRATPQLQSYGLESLSIAEVVTLSPNFNTTKLYYRIGVELDANIKHLRLVPNALDESATIRIASNNGFDETVQSGTTSSAIMLHSTDTTVITIEVAGDRRVQYRFEVDYFFSGAKRDVDTDRDGLIEILTLDDLDAMRNALDGSHLRHQNNDDVVIENAKGCPITGCKGYELLRDLDFDNPAHYRTGRVNSAWTTGAGWQPIGTQRHPFVATFQGNGYTISNLRVNRPDSEGGLFGMIDGRETDVAIERLGLSNVDIVGGTHVGGLVGYNQAGDISKSYVTGSVAARGRNGSAIVGGLVGRNVGGSITESYSETQVRCNLVNGLTTSLVGGLVALNDNRARIENSYAIGSVIGQDSVGGLVASNQGSSKIINSYAVSKAIAIGAMSEAGGLVAVNDATVDDSYWDIEASGVASSAGGTSETTIILQTSTPTEPPNSIYRNWDTDVWEFADANRYPTLKAIANVSLLAPTGKSLLQSLTLSNNVRLFPSFHPLIFDYDIIAASEQMTEVRIDTTSTQVGTTIDVACSDGLICASSIPVSFVLDGSYTPKITISTRTPDDRVLAYNFSIRYATSKIKQATETATTTTSLPLTVAEGERIRLITLYNFGLNENSYSYRWRQSEGDVLRFNDLLSPVDTQSNMLDFTAPIDVVSKQDDSRTVQLILEVAVNEDMYLSKAVPLIVFKRNNDTADRIRLIRHKTLYTYIILIEREDGSQFVDRDGGFAQTHIQWQRRRNATEDWVNVGSGSPYTLPNEGAYQYRALATYEDNQGYRQQFETEVINYLDIDEDGDGLIEIRYLEELNAIRHQLDGSGYKATASADKVTAGCPVVNNVEECRGYELMNDLDFTDDASYRTSDRAARSVLKNSWTVSELNDVSDFTNASDVSWQPIGEEFNAVFNGNGYTISNMQINRSVGNTKNIGLFSQIGAAGRIENLGLVDAAIKGLTGNKNVGGIAGQIDGKSVILNSYVVGDVVAGNTDKIISGDVGVGFIGGLVGHNLGDILNSYAEINVIADDSNTLLARNKRAIVGGLVGRNFSGKVHNSYATGEVKGPCQVGGLVGNQASNSEIKNSYARGNVVTGFGTCSNSDNKWVGGLIASNDSSTIDDSYALGAVSGGGARSGGLVGQVSPTGDNSIANPDNSYWNFDANCRYFPTPFLSYNRGMYCYSRRANTITLLEARTENSLRSTTRPSAIVSCVNLANGTYDCPIFSRWNTADWNFGTNQQYPTLKYGTGSDTENPGCDNDAETELPSCNALLNGQIADALLLNNLSLSANSRNVQLTPGFLPSRFNYQAVIEPEVLPVVIKLATDADAGAEITIRKDGGTPLVKQSDGSVQISTNDSFNLEIKTASGNEREANYQIQVHLEYQPQPQISKVVGGSTPSEVIRANILSFDEGDVVRLDASTSFGQNSSQLDYQWSQVSGKLLLSGIQTASILEFTIPTDFIARDENDSIVVLKLELSERNNPASVVSREVPLLVRKVNNGNFEGAVKWITSETLSLGDLDDIDGGVLTDISYQWSRRQNAIFFEIPGANQKSYTPPEDVRNAQYRLSISYTDGQGYQTDIDYNAPMFADIATHRDKDGDGLIEIETLEDLHAIRYQPDGSGYRASSTASKITTGCPDNGCEGYELVRDLDFLDEASYSSLPNRATWTSGVGWQPIGTITNNDCSDSASNCFSSIFEGNGYSIANLRINRGTINEVGLFAVNTGTIRNLRLSAIEVTGNTSVGGLVGRNEGQLINVYVIEGKVVGQNDVIGLLTGQNMPGSSVINSYVYGTVTGMRWVGGICGANRGEIINSYAVANVSAEQHAGGLVGENQAPISNSYVAGSVSISERGQAVGGLVGTLWVGGSVKNSYSTAEVKVTFDIQSDNDERSIGGLIGRRHSSQAVTNSYWDTDTSGQMNSPGGGIAKTKAELQMPTAPGTMVGDVYYTWDTGDWDFGGSKEYPVLRYHDNTCGTSTPSPNCGELLLHQRIGLRDLRLEQNGHLRFSPDFDPAVTAYTVSVDADASELKIIPIAVNPNASIVVNGKVLPANDAGYTIALNTFETTSTVIRVAASSLAGTEDPVVYKLTINGNRLPRISINAPALISEGETLAFNAIIEDPEGDELSYSLTMIPDLLPDWGLSTGTVVGRADLRYELNIPSDLFGEMQSSDDVEIFLAVDDGLNVVSETARLTIVKEHNGIISIPTPTLNDFTYTIEDIDLSLDTDGINPNPQIAYQWQKELFGSWLDIDGATNASYTVEGIIGNRYRVLVDYTDKQGYRHRRLVSSAVSAPQQFIYNVERSRDVVRELVDRLPGIFINVRVLLEGLLSR